MNFISFQKGSQIQLKDRCRALTSCASLMFRQSQVVDQGVGNRTAAAQAAEHLPKARLQAITAGATPTPAVTVPKTAPAPE